MRSQHVAVAVLVSLALCGCPDHSCAPVLLTTGRISYAVSTSGLYARDVDSG